MSLPKHNSTAARHGAGWYAPHATNMYCTTKEDTANNCSTCRTTGARQRNLMMENAYTKVAQEHRDILEKFMNSHKIRPTRPKLHDVPGRCSQKQPNIKPPSDQESINLYNAVYEQNSIHHHFLQSCSHCTGANGRRSHHQAHRHNADARNACNSSPLDGAEISDRAVSFQWPLPAGLNILRSGLDGAEENTPKKTDKASYATSCATANSGIQAGNDRTSRDAGRSSTPNRIWLRAHGTGNTAMLRTERPNGAIRCNLR